MASRANPGYHPLPVKAPAGQASTQRLQLPQKCLATGGPLGRSMSVNTVPNRTHEPNGRVTSWQ